MDTARKNGGVMAEVATNVNESSGDYLDGPILRVGSEDVPGLIIENLNSMQC